MFCQLSVSFLFFFLFSLLPLSQSGYSECAQLILQYHPKQVDQVVRLAMQETVSEPKMLGLLQDLCRSSTELLVAVVSKIAEAATTAGQELLRYGTQY